MKRIKYLTLTAFLSMVLSACAPPPSDYEARNELKLIRLSNISELSLQDNFIVGFGDSTNNNAAFSSDEVGYVIEITIKPDSNIPQSCVEALHNDKFPKQILAYGKYNNREDDGDNYIRQIMLSDIVECEAGKEVKWKHPKHKSGKRKARIEDQNT